MMADTAVDITHFYSKIKFYIEKMAETFLINAGRIML